MQHIFLEMILLSLCAKDSKKNDNGDGSAPCTLAVAVSDDEEVDDEFEEEEEDDDSEEEDEVVSYDQKWLKFVVKVASLNDPLVHSVFKQARFIEYVSNAHHLSVELSKDFILFKEWLDSTRSLWQPLLREFFSVNVILDIQFTGTSSSAKATEDRRQTEVQIKKIKNDEENRRDERIISKQQKPIASKQQSSFVKASENKQQFSAGARYSNQKATVASINRNEVRVDVSDENRWKKASMLMRHFPGVITEIRENQ